MPKKLLFLMILLCIPLLFGATYDWVRPAQEAFNESANYNFTGNVTFINATGIDSVNSSDYWDTFDTVEDLNLTKSVTIVIASNTSRGKDFADFVADGTDDHLQFNEAVSALPDSGGRIILLEGTYSNSSTYDIDKNNIIVEGQGYSTILESGILVEDGATSILIKNLQTKGGIYIFDGEDVTIDNVFFNSTLNTIGIFFQGIDKNFRLQNSYIYESGPLIFYGTDQAYITNNLFENTQGMTVVGNEWFITNNLFINITSDPVILLNPYYVDTIIANNIFDTDNTWCIRTLHPVNVLITQNTFDQCDTAIWSDSGLHNSTITTNIIKNSNVAINISTQQSTNNMISNNILAQNNITIYDEGTDTTIIGNFPGGASMEIQTAVGQEIKMVPEGTHTTTYYPDKTNSSMNFTSTKSICDGAGCIVNRTKTVNGGEIELEFFW